MGMISRTKIMIGSGPEDETKEEEKEVKEVHIKKINNGYLISTCGPYSENETEFAKKLAAAPAIVERLMGIKDKSKGYYELKDMVRKEKALEEDE